MAVLKSIDGKQMAILCKCGCDEGIRIHVNTDYGDFAYVSYISGNFYKEQAGLIRKLKKIWAIIRNKDFYYSDIVLSKAEWDEYVAWINSFGKDEENDDSKEKSLDQ